MACILLHNSNLESKLTDSVGTAKLLVWVVGAFQAGVGLVSESILSDVSPKSPDAILIH